MPSVDEDNVVEKGELEATKVNYTLPQKKYLIIE